jgi:hypothetical protein
VTNRTAPKRQKMATQIQTRVFCKRRLLVVNRHKESQREKKTKKKKPNPSSFSSSSFSPFQWPEKATHKKEMKRGQQQQLKPSPARDGCLSQNPISGKAHETKKRKSTHSKTKPRKKKEKKEKNKDNDNNLLLPPERNRKQSKQ